MQGETGNERHDEQYVQPPDPATAAAKVREFQQETR
jgi:hypothetical protein